ncbi:MAG: alpha/beta hydrolase [Candidatus Kariarchaeaceae archaeon]|jgi:pimeloyl-ACP methyl ester carboxylesterase
MFDDPLISSLVFHPRRTRLPTDLSAHIHPLQLQISDEIMIGGLFFLKDKDLPSILMFHGNGEVAQDYIQLSELFLNIDVNFAVVDYRGYGFSSGSPYYSSLINDAMPIYNCFKSWMIDQNISNSLFVMGRSLGSVCAAEIGSHNPAELKGIFFESGFASVYNLMTRLFGLNESAFSQESVIDFSNDTKIKKIQKPVLIIHGTNDQIIPFSESELILQSLPDQVKSTHVPIKGGGHNNLFMYPQLYFPPLQQFIGQNK